MEKNLLDTVDELRRMSEAELANVAEDGLTSRLRAQAGHARDKYRGLRPSNLGAFLADSEFIRYPTRLVLEFGEMGTHQFAHPEPDIRNPGGVMLYLRPILGKHPDYLVRAVSYMIPVINFGKIISDDHCLIYGAALLGLDVGAYYDAICELADFVGAEPAEHPAPVNPSQNPSTPTCGHNCHCAGQST
ncbi:MAG: hypothetical protein M2R45_01934 [Verrucomicrobia subdivision 3 bacterium]|nr:hypothetical protein [Limisphaerales bacterium]MCS1416200.1 hypothetical protein [Limisphaerales bacterium]